mmetsp:Transcript_58688/g.181983  ORF Transcript_58688/g.181983 Transcript_58688/m.181983 type:complete len:201 (-) Transcript_58688:111-713(-)
MEVAPEDHVARAGAGLVEERQHSVATAARMRRQRWMRLRVVVMVVVVVAARPVVAAAASVGRAGRVALAAVKAAVVADAAVHRARSPSMGRNQPCRILDDLVCEIRGLPPAAWHSVFQHVMLGPVVGRRFGLLRRGCCLCRGRLCVRRHRWDHASCPQLPQREGAGLGREPGRTLLVCLKGPGCHNVALLARGRNGKEST